MIENTRVIDAPPEQVWKVLADGWLYPLWVVGATRMRGVDETWPDVDAKLHHSVGVWPLVIDDDTLVLDSEPGRLLRLRAAGWPLGEAVVEIHLEPDGSRTRVLLREDATQGPGRLAPRFVRRPMIKWRNTETLTRLALVAEGRGPL